MNLTTGEGHHSIKLNEDHTCPPLKPTKVPVYGISSFQCVDCTTQLGVISKPDQGTLNSTVCVTGKDYIQFWSQYQLLRNTACH